MQEQLARAEEEETKKAEKMMKREATENMKQQRIVAEILARLEQVNAGDLTVSFAHIEAPNEQIELLIKRH